MKIVEASGPRPARILIVGEAPGVEEEIKGEPFVGSSGKLLDEILGEVGLDRAVCRVTNVCQIRPPRNKIEEFFYNKTEAKQNGAPLVMGCYCAPAIIDGLKELEREVRVTNPDMIIALGNVAMWACTGIGGATVSKVRRKNEKAPSGIRLWRGSQMTSRWGQRLVPSYHPAYILRNWEDRRILRHDLAERVAPYISKPFPLPDYRFHIRPSFAEVMTFLDRVEALPLDHYVSVDIENRCNHIACVGLGISRLEAMCIPFMSATKVEGYWDLEEEVAIIIRLVKILAERAIVGQNFIHDMQYLARDWGAKCNIVMDTMLAQHVMFSHMQKALYFLSSLYCAYHTFWKDEGKDWTPDLPEEQFWSYNCKDCVTTFEIATEVTEILKKSNMWKQFREQQDRIYPIAFEAMLRGVKIDKKLRAEFGDQLMESIGNVEQWFVDVLGFKLNPRSAPQMRSLFYDDFKCERQYNRKTKSISLDDDALDNISAKNPELKPLCHYIKTYRSLGIFLGTFVQAKLDDDGRMRCSYKTATVETYRWASAKSAFDTGTNLQNIPRNRDPDEEKTPTPGWQRDPWIEFPGIRRMFIPDEGMFIADFDLARADAQVVAWEADDPILKQMFREGVDLHAINAKDAGVTRQLAKNGIHAINYGVHARTLALTLGITVHEAERFINRWFAAHPWIKEWHRRVEGQLYGKLHMVENKFGYRRYYFDRPEGLLGEALAWVPQSTVGLVINYGAANIREQLPWVQTLLQVHDSLVVQFKKTDFHLRNEIRDKLLITIPYDDPLVIPVGMKISDKSWGDCEPCEWKIAA